MKKVIIIKLVKPPAMAAFICTVPRRDRNSRSIKTIAVSLAWETTIGRAMASISRKPPGSGCSGNADFSVIFSAIPSNKTEI